MAVFYQVAYLTAAVRDLRPGQSVPSRPFATDGRTVTGVDGNVAAAGLHVGDEIRTVNDVDFSGDRFFSSS